MYRSSYKKVRFLCQATMRKPPNHVSWIFRGCADKTGNVNTYLPIIITILLILYNDILQSSLVSRKGQLLCNKYSRWDVNKHGGLASVTAGWDRPQNGCSIGKNWGEITLIDHLFGRTKVVLLMRHISQRYFVSTTCVWWKERHRSVENY